jgi:hypothetical protein
MEDDIPKRKFRDYYLRRKQKKVTVFVQHSNYNIERGTGVNEHDDDDDDDGGGMYIPA